MFERFRARKEICIPCLFEVPGLTPLSGQTRDLSSQVASIQSLQLSITSLRRPKLGDTGVLTLSFRVQGAPRETLKLQARVAHMSGVMLGLQLNTSLLTEPQKEAFVRLLGTVTR